MCSSFSAQAEKLAVISLHSVLSLLMKVCRTSLCGSTCAVALA
jgi:hypothetical protein